MFTTHNNKEKLAIVNASTVETTADVLHTIEDDSVREAVCGKVGQYVQRWTEAGQMASHSFLREGGGGSRLCQFVVATRNLP